MKEKTRILYFMNVDWNWIKQRPHFIAEGLSKENNVKVIYQYRYNRKGLQKNQQTVPLKPLYVLPKIDNYKYLKRINLFIRKYFVKRTIKEFKPDVLYLTYPTQIYSIPKDYAGKVIYDCMDDHLAIDGQISKEIFEAEKILTRRANIILASSESLKDKLERRYKVTDIHIVRNGFNGPIYKIDDRKKTLRENKNSTITFAYIGTISHWFNNKLIKKSLKDVSNLHYLLIGPVDKNQKIDDSRVVYAGTVSHDQLYKKIQNVDALIMPFKVNKIIESVDPVKLYEYINFDKNILSVKYKEIERFEPFVYFYNTYSDYLNQLRRIKQAKTIKYTSLERKKFLNENSWLERVNEINMLMKKA